MTQSEPTSPHTNYSQTPRRNTQQKTDKKDNKQDTTKETRTAEQINKEGNNEQWQNTNNCIIIAIACLGLYEILNGQVVYQGNNATQ